MNNQADYQAAYLRLYEKYERLLKFVRMVKANYPCNLCNCIGCEAVKVLNQTDY